MYIAKNLGERVKNLREEKNYTQQHIANKLGISQKAYSKIETGETKLSVDNLIKIAEILETTLYRILNLDGSTTYNNFNTHNGEGIVIHKSTSDKLEALYDKLLKSKDEQISILNQQNEFLQKTIDNIIAKQDK
jgi:transcriptional regulator with XRE-family HTH domain